LFAPILSYQRGRPTTCATILLKAGQHPKFVQEMLGHATIAITLDTYSHVLPGMGGQTAEALR